MESYVTSIQGDGVETIQREKINAVIRQMNHVVNSFKEKVTEQNYGEISYDGKLTSSITVSKRPKRPIPIIARIGYSNFYVGDLTTYGTLAISTIDAEQERTKTVNLIESREDVTDRETETQPISKIETIEEKSYTDTYDYDGVVYTKTGTKTKKRYTVVEEYQQYSEDTELYWIWSGYILVVTTDEYKITSDLSNGNIHIYQKYET